MLLFTFIISIFSLVYSIRTIKEIKKLIKQRKVTEEILMFGGSNETFWDNLDSTLERLKKTP